MARIEIVTVPDLGDFAEVDVSEVLVAVGDRVELDGPLVSLETDKATMDVPSTVAGVVAEVLVAVGTKVAKGAPIAKISVAEPVAEPVAEAGERGGAAEAPWVEPPVPALAAPPPPVEAPAPPVAAPAPPVAAPAPLPRPLPDERGVPGAAPHIDEAAFRAAHASPGVRRLARELGVDLGRVPGSGRKGRVTREDVTAWVTQRLAEPRAAGVAAGAGIPPMPAIDFSRFGPVEEVPLSKIRRLTAENLTRAWLHVPHVTQHDEADVTDLERFREGLASSPRAAGVKVTPLAFVLKACAVVLTEMPDFNASLAPDGQTLIRKRYYHLGIAVDTPAGLVVPVVRDVERKGILELARELADLGARTRERKVGLEDLQGASFSVSNLGGVGGTGFTPIVNAPEVAILGVSRTRVLPRWNGEGFEPRRMMPLSLSYDHRVIDGAAAARFAARLAELLGDIRQLVL
jgi:pyruvate dehydrogenase E2 component (dihydrolipoamide acetyltransferase)